MMIILKYGSNCYEQMLITGYVLPNRVSSVFLRVVNFFFPLFMLSGTKDEIMMINKPIHTEMKDDERYSTTGQ